MRTAQYTVFFSKTSNSDEAFSKIRPMISTQKLQFVSTFLFFHKALARLTRPLSTPSYQMIRKGCSRQHSKLISRLRIGYRVSRRFYLALPIYNKNSNGELNLFFLPCGQNCIYKPFHYIPYLPS